MQRQKNEVATQVPPPGDDRRAWIRFQLQSRVNPATGRRYTQEDIAREAYVSAGTVSFIFKGDRVSGPRIYKVMRITARVLGMTTDELFGVWLESGDGYAGSDPKKKPVEEPA